MSSNPTLTSIRRTLKEKGEPAMKNARNAIMLEFKDNSYSSQALRYFSKVTLNNALPVFPALITLSCEAVGGEPEKTVPFGEAIVLISGAADLHDDAIDQSIAKGKKQTVLGKFGLATTILAGDMLLVAGFRRMTEATASLDSRKSKELIRLVSEAVFEICSAEALEQRLHRKIELSPNRYNEVIRLKAVVPELSMKIGGILGNGNSGEIECLGGFGRIYGINSIIIEEFVDLLNFQETRNRVKNECPPLPVIYALKNEQIRNNLLFLLNSELNEEKYKKMVEVTLGAKEVKVLGKLLVSNSKKAIKLIPENIKGNIREELENLVLVPLNYIEV